MKQKAPCMEAGGGGPHPVALLRRGAGTHGHQHRETLPEGNGKESLSDEQSTEIRQNVCLHAPQQLRSGGHTGQGLFSVRSNNL